MNTEDYRNAPSDIGPLADQWKDKPHRLVYDLCRYIENLFVLKYSKRCLSVNFMMGSEKELIDYLNKNIFPIQEFIQEINPEQFDDRYETIRRWYNESGEFWEIEKVNRIV